MNLTQRWLHGEFGDPRETPEKWERYLSNRDSFNRREADFIRDHPGEAIAVYDDGKYLHRKELEDVIGDLIGIGSPPGKAYIDVTYVAERRPFKLAT